VDDFAQDFSHEATTRAPAAGPLRKVA